MQKKYNVCMQGCCYQEEINLGNPAQITLEAELNGVQEKNMTDVKLNIVGDIPPFGGWKIRPETLICDNIPGKGLRISITAEHENENGSYDYYAIANYIGDDKNKDVDKLNQICNYFMELLINIVRYENPKDFEKDHPALVFGRLVN